MYKNIFIDLDNTLWDFQTNSKNVLSVLFFKYGLDKYFKDFDEYFKIYSGHNDYLWEQYALNKINKDELNKDRFAYPLKEKNLDLPEVEQGMQCNYLPLLSQQTVLMPGCKDTLDYLKSKGYKLYLVSNGFVEIQHKKLSGAGLYKYFDKLFFSEEIKAHKPSRLFFDTAIKSTNSKKKESIVIGDNFLADIQGAKNAGLHQIWFCTSASPDKLALPFTPTYTITQLTDLKDIL